MTSDEAISIMNAIVHMLEPQYDTDRIEDSVEMAIKALEQEPCDDAISREAVMHILDEVGGDFDSPREAVVPIDYIADMVSKLPPVTAQPKMGYISIDDVMSVFDDFMRGDADENDTKTFLAMLKDKAESEG